MDSVTQATLGAAIGEAVLGRKIGNKGMLWGAIAATLPDLDVIFVPLYNNIQRISIHRGYSHSILVSVVVATLLAWLFYKWKAKSGVKFFEWWGLFFLALFTHILLDSFTTYGTQLFLPFSDYRVGLDSITIIDPFYTVPLLAGILSALFFARTHPKRRLANNLGLIISTLYLSFTMVNKSRINNVVESSLEQQQINYESFLTIPASAGSLLWYGVAKSPEGLYIGDYSVFDKEGNIDFEFFPTNEALLKDVEDEYLIDRMKWFAGGYYTVAEEDGIIRFYNLKCDMTGSAGEKNEAPTTFFFEITKNGDGSLGLASKMHHQNERYTHLGKLQRIFGNKIF